VSSLSDSHQEKVRSAVKDAYGQIARRVGDQGGSVGCCTPKGEAVPKSSSSCCPPPDQSAIDCGCGCGCGATGANLSGSCASSTNYSTQELNGLPESVTDASLGCGNPLAIAGLQPGETVLDLGSGGGIDCFLAARQVGPQGKVIGLDMTLDMIKLARRNVKKVGATNVEFRYGEMEDMPLPDQSVDVIISNCVINLSPDKDAVFREAFRVLRPGGRLHVSDIVTKGELPSAVASKLDAWAGCIAGALDESVYLDKIQSAGFRDVEVVSRSRSATETLTEEEAHLLAGDALGTTEAEAIDDIVSDATISVDDLARMIVSVKVQAHKPL